MAGRGSQMERALQFFREGQLDVVRVSFQLVKEVVEARLAEGKSTASRQAKAASTPRAPRKKRRTKAQMEAAKEVSTTPINSGSAPHQRTIEEQVGSITV